MVLYAENRVVAVAETFQRLVIQITCVISTSLRFSESGSTAKPWLWEVISTRLVIVDGVIGAAVAELEFVRLAADR